MKKLLIFLLVIMTGLFACKKDFEEIQGPIDTTNELKATITVVEGESIQAAINGAVAGDLIDVQAGTYNERVHLKDGVDLNFQSGAIVEFTTPVITDRIEGGQYYQTNPVVCNITGDGLFKTSTSGYYGVVDLQDPGTIVNGTGDIEVLAGGGYGLYIGNAGGSWIDSDTTSHTIHMTSGTSGIFYGPDMGSGNDYTFFGNVYCDYVNPWIATTAVEVAGGSLDKKLDLSGYFYSENYYGLNLHGGNVYIHDAVIQSNTGVANWQEYGGDAIWICNGFMPGGPGLQLARVTLLASPYVTQDPNHWWYGVWSIGNEGCGTNTSYMALITCLDTVWVNMQYIIDSVAPDGTQWYPLNWAPGSEDYVVALPPTNLEAIVTQTEVTLTWEEANLAYPATWDTYKVLKNGNQIGISNNGNFTDPNPSSGIYTVASTMTGWPVHDGLASIEVEASIQPVTNLTYVKNWGKVKNIVLDWDSDGDFFIIFKEPYLPNGTGTLEEIGTTTETTFTDNNIVPWHGAKYIVYNGVVDPSTGTEIIIPKD